MEAAVVMDAPPGYEYFARLNEDGTAAYAPSAPRVDTNPGIWQWDPRQLSRDIAYRPFQEWGQSAKDYGIVAEHVEGGQFIQPTVLACLANGHIVVVGRTLTLAYDGPERSGIAIVNPKPQTRPVSTLFASDNRQIGGAALDRGSLTILAELWTADRRQNYIVILSGGKIKKTLGGVMRSVAARGSPWPMLLDVNRDIAIVTNPSAHAPPLLISIREDRRISHFGTPPGLPQNMRICGTSWLPNGDMLVGYATNNGHGGALYRVRANEHKLQWKRVGSLALRGASRTGGVLLLSGEDGKGTLVTLK
jgi:hypothetical protein